MSSADFPERAGTVIIGAGIVGNSLVYHLADQGKEDILQIDKGPLPDPGGSTGHASNFIMPIEHTSEMTELTWDSIEQFDEEGLFTNPGGLEVARTETRMEELRRRVQSANAFGTDAKILGPEEVEELVPHINEDIIQGAMYTPDAGTCDPLRFGEIMRERAKNMGALTVSPNTKVTDIIVEDGVATAVETDRGTVHVEDELVIAAGVWSPKLAEMAGAKIPLTPAAHQMISVGPIEKFKEFEGEVNFPIVRDMDVRMYERQHGNDLEVGSYEHRPILYDVEEIPSNEEAPLSPTQLPLTEDAFEDSMEHALQIMPEILDEPDAEIHHSIDGLISITPDGNPVVGPVRDVDNLWSVAAIWIRLAPGIAKEVARWMTDGWGAMETDMHSLNIARFDGWGRGKKFVKDRGAEEFSRHYGIIHPNEQFSAGREKRTAPFYDRQQEHDANFQESGGWERPRWYEGNSDLLERYEDEIADLRRPNDWDSDWWSPNILAEHVHVRNNVGMIGDTGFAIYDVVGENATEYLDRMVVGRMNVEVGKTVYTPALDSDAGFRADITVARLGRDHYRIITGGSTGGDVWQWFYRHIEQDEDVTLVDKSSSLSTIGLWGPDARNVLESLTDQDISNDAFPAFTAQDVTIGEVESWAMRISYIGELGWELYAPMEQSRRLWDLLAEAGEEYDIRPIGTGVYGGTGRIEKNYRLYGHELRQEYNPVEADLTFHGVKDADFLGKEAYAEAFGNEPAANLCTMSVDDHAPNGDEKRFMLGGEPILSEDGETLIDAEGRRSYVTSANSAPTLGKHLLMGYIPTEYAEEGGQLTVQYFGEEYPVTIERVGSEPLFDPDNERLFG